MSVENAKARLERAIGEGDVKRSLAEIAVVVAGLAAAVEELERKVGELRLGVTTYEGGTGS